MSDVLRPDAEWLEADGLGGFAMGTVSGIRTRRYHGLLTAARTPPTGRVTLVAGIEASVESEGRSFALTSHRYVPDVIHPDGARRIAAFAHEPWPAWQFRLDDGSLVEFELFVPHEIAAVVLSWRRRGGESPARLTVRPLLAARDLHGLQHQHEDFAFDAAIEHDRVVWHPDPRLPGIVARSNGAYRHAPDWYRQFRYAEETARGLDDTEDLAAPGTFTFDLAREALLVFSTAGGAFAKDFDVAWRVAAWRSDERRRRAAFASPLHRAADAYRVRRGIGKTVIAGYPWFTDWGRDTFIALRGLCLATGCLADAAAILGAWADAVSDGMVPNRFTDDGDAPEFNSVDASLWFVIAADATLKAFARSGTALTLAEGERLSRAVDAILTRYAEGARHGIRMASDGLLACGEPGVQLTWMDAKAGDWVVTPRIGKPVEVQALWINALHAGAAFSTRWERIEARARATFPARFFDEALGFLRDVVDVEHVSGAVDATLRPNQVFALGGLPVALLDEERSARALEVVESRLWTPLGLRTLDPAHPDYRGRYQGDRLARDGAYHQGTVWPWLTGAFVEAWVRVRGGTAAAKGEAWERFVRPLEAHLGEAGLGHVSEIADGDPPHTPRGCPFQAWSVAELLRLEHDVLAGRERRAAEVAHG